MKEERLICCDWGTSTFRMYLVDTRHITILHEVKSHDGVSVVNDRYSAQCSKGRMEYYIDVLNNRIARLEHQSSEDLTGIPIIMSGMASSTIGLVEVDYGFLPFSLSHPKLEIKEISRSDLCNHDIYVFGGLRSEDDVMRGEELQLLGIRDVLLSQDCTCILPGTHSKHVIIKDGSVIGFDTFMTGELFQLFSKYSILKNSVVDNFLEENEEVEFLKGVSKGSSTDLSKHLFKVRTRDILGSYTHKSNYHYLSGFLIGNELKSIDMHVESICVCGDEKLIKIYDIALKSLFPNKSITVIDSDQLKEVIPKAHTYLYNYIQNG